MKSKEARVDLESIAANDKRLGKLSGNPVGVLVFPSEVTTNSGDSVLLFAEN